MAGSGSKKTLFMIVGLVLLIGGVGFGGFMMGGGGKKAAAGKKGDAVNEEIATDAAAEGKKAEAKKEGGEGHGEAKSEGHGESKGEGKGEGAKGESVQASKKEITFKLENIQVNLFDPKARTFIQTSIMIEATSAETYKKLEENEYPLRDTTIALLSSKTVGEIVPPEGRERLKRELLARYEGKLGQKVVNDIYLVDLKVINQ